MQVMADLAAAKQDITRLQQSHAVSQEAAREMEATRSALTQAESRSTAALEDARRAAASQAGQLASVSKERDRLLEQVLRITAHLWEKKSIVQRKQRLLIIEFVILAAWVNNVSPLACQYEMKAQMMQAACSDLI